MRAVLLAAAALLGGAAGQTQNPTWNYVTGGVVESSPAVALDGAIYVGSVDQNMRAFFPDGTLKWTFKAGGAIYSSPRLSSDQTLVLFGSDDKNVYCLNAADGKLVWNYATTGIVRSTPAFSPDGQSIAVGSDDGYLYYFYTTASSGNNALRWYYQASYAIRSDPTINAAGQIIFGDDGNYVSWVDATGNLIAYYQTGGKVQSSAAIASDGGVVIGSGDGYLYKLQLAGTTVTRVWRFSATDTIYSQPQIDAAGNIYFGTAGGLLVASNVYCVTPDGKQKWLYNGGLTVQGPYAESATLNPAANLLYIGTGDNYLLAITMDTGKVAWKFKAGGAVYTKPGLSLDGQPIVGSDDRKIYYFGAKPTVTPTQTPSPSQTASSTPTGTATLTPGGSSSGTASATPTASVTGTAPVTATSTTTADPTNTATPSNSPTPSGSLVPAKPSDDNKPLSTGASVGIALGVLGGVAAAALFYYRPSFAGFGSSSSSSSSSGGGDGGYGSGAGASEGVAYAASGGAGMFAASRAGAADPAVRTSLLSSDAAYAAPSSYGAATATAAAVPSGGITYSYGGPARGGRLGREASAGMLQPQQPAAANVW